MSAPFGGGQLSYPPVKENLESLETSIQANAAQIKKLTDFKLIEGYVAAEVYGTPAILKAINRHEQVFVVDVGAVNLAQKYANAFVKVEDIYYQYNKYHK